MAPGETPLYWKVWPPTVTVTGLAELALGSPIVEVTDTEVAPTPAPAASVAVPIER